MHKIYTCLGLMSGTSGDGVDASVISSNGVDSFEVIKNKYFEYDSSIYKKIHTCKEKIFNNNDLIKLSDELVDLERQITVFHAKVFSELNLKNEINLIGFHGQTIYHNASEKISKQLGDGKLLSQLTKKKVVFNFRKNDILNDGEGAPLTPIFHQQIISKKKLSLPICILNIGGISNITIVKDYKDFQEIFSQDIGPGNCLIDNWIRKNSNQNFDYDGKLANVGKNNEIIYEQAQDLYSNRKDKNKKSFDINDFDISFVRGLSLEDGAATLTEFSASIIADTISTIVHKENKLNNILVCGGGRKNKVLMKAIQNKLPQKIKMKLIDEYNIDGDFVESQAFAFLAIRTCASLPISFPNTTNCSKPTIGGEVIDN